MRLSDLYANSEKSPTEIEIERELKMFSKEIHRDETDSHIYVPFHLRGENYDDSYDSELDDRTESNLLDRENNRLRRKAKDKRKAREDVAFKGF